MARPKIEEGIKQIRVHVKILNLLKEIPGNTWNNKIKILYNFYIENKR